MPQAPRIHFLTLGCPKNESDTLKMDRLVREAGFEVTVDAEEADAIVLNTCAFLEAATEESIEAILDLSAEWKNPQRRLVVAGCMPARYRDDLSGELPEVDAFIPVEEESRIARVLSGVLGVSPEPTQATFELEAPFAYLSVCDGCDMPCTFCTIPSIRGPFASRTPEELSIQARELVEAGARELILVGQDVSSYGRDLDADFTLASLVRQIAQTPDLDWLRLMYLQPRGITDGLLQAIVDTPAVCRYLDIPLQHVAGPVLRAMRRTGSAGEYLALLERVRAAIPDVVLRTTLITGFPGESDEHVDELLDFIEQARIDYVGVFTYSPEEGTSAATLPDQVPHEIAKERAQAVRDAADAVSFGVLDDLVGSTLDVLVDGTDEEGPVGRWRGQAPEVDGVIHLFDDVEPGDIVRATVIERAAYDLIAKAER